MLIGIVSMSAKEIPERINLTREEAEALKFRIHKNQLTEEDLKLLGGLVSFNLWLQQQLSLAKISIHKLKQFFGFSTEKKSPKSR